MKTALEFYTEHEPHYNCAQSVAAAFGGDVEAMSAFGGGRAPDGLCGALYAAQLLVPEEKRAGLQEKFRSCLGGVRCAELKGTLKVPCPVCVEMASSLLSGMMPAAEKPE